MLRSADLRPPMPSFWCVWDVLFCFVFLYRCFVVVVVVWSGHFFLTCHTMDNSTTVGVSRFTLCCVGNELIQFVQRRVCKTREKTATIMYTAHTHNRSCQPYYHSLRTSNNIFWKSMLTSHDRFPPKCSLSIGIPYCILFECRLVKGNDLIWNSN